MNATPTPFFPSASRIWLLSLALTACGIETAPNLNPALGGAGADGGAGTDAGAPTSGSGASGRSGAGAGGKAGSSGKAGSAGEAEAGGMSGAGDGAGTGAGAGGEAGSAGGEPECDESKSPKDEPCLVADEYAVFVAPTGAIGAVGTMDSPLPTVSAGIAAALANEVPRVIVCGGVVYPEVVEITAGIRVYGGFSCSDEPWEHTGAATLVQPSAKGEALRIVDVEDAVLIEDMEFKAQNAELPGESSVAALVKGSAAVTLKGVKLTAGDGMDGANGGGGTLEPFTYPKTGETGATPSQLCQPSDTDCLAGFPASGNSGGDEKDHACPAGDVTTVGGAGGNNGTSGPKSGEPGIPSLGLGTRGEPGDSTLLVPTTCGLGVVGAAGGEGDEGDGAATLGSIDPDGWTPVAGTAGGHGKTGQGGGGGGAQKPNGGGGGGGAGGCGGKAGGAGSGGGASIALLAVSSTVSLEGSTLATGAAGDGGTGTAGQPGMAHGGVGGSSPKCGGGDGGGGGSGGDGGGGAGGISVGIVWTGTEPAIDEDTRIEHGSQGLGGAGGNASNGGIGGIAEEILGV